jgi:hypothetical protein
MLAPTYHVRSYMSSPLLSERNPKPKTGRLLRRNGLRKQRLQLVRLADLPGTEARARKRNVRRTEHRRQLRGRVGVRRTPPALRPWRPAQSLDRLG